ncbi:hypothetical protein C1645_842206 [Glomus cerebriforme]|uniref:Uncharacterized protein n=1 Tax=Glomus cerebriforme TaxID=658196 RepID=A0A397RWY0_9GLOM|nr:hypothetical protein C1645_842206 [Glomus cerebriforme]
MGKLFRNMVDIKFICRFLRGVDANFKTFIIDVNTDKTIYHLKEKIYEKLHSIKMNDASNLKSSLLHGNDNIFSVIEVDNLKLWRVEITDDEYQTLVLKNDDTKGIKVLRKKSTIFGKTNLLMGHLPTQDGEQSVKVVDGGETNGVFNQKIIYQNSYSLDNLNNIVIDMVKEINLRIEDYKPSNDDSEEEDDIVINEPMSRTENITNVISINEQINQINQNLNAILPHKVLCEKCKNYVQDLKRRQKTANYCILGVKKGKVPRPRYT